MAAWVDYPEHGGNLRWAAEAFGREPGDFLDFSSSLNPLGPPPAVREFWADLARGSREAWRSLTAYPDPQAREARRALARFLGVPEEAVLLTNGGTEAIRLTVLFWCRKSAGLSGYPSLVTWAPAFGEYERAARALGMPVLRVFLDFEGLVLPIPALLPLARPGTVFFFCHPHSPTGFWVDPGEILRFHEALPPGAAAAVDEAFLWLAERAWPLQGAGSDGASGFCTLARAAAEREGLFVIGSLTKAFALPGVRMGYVVGRPEEVRGMEELQPAWSASGPAQALVPLCLQEAEGGYIVRTLGLLRREKRRIEAVFSADPVLSRSFRLWPAEANFYLAREGGEETGAQGREVEVREKEPLFALLGRRGVLVRDLSSVPGLGRGYFRFAVRGEEENAVLLEALREAAHSRPAVSTAVSPSAQA